MGIKFQKKAPPEAEVTKVMKESGKTVAETSKTEKVEDAPGVGDMTDTEVQPWCQVGVQSSYTHNLGNYQSVKIGVSIMIPCKPPEINEVYQFCKDFVDDRLTKEIADLEANAS